MKIFVVVKPKRKTESVIRVDYSHYLVSVKAPAQEGRANLAVISALAKYFKIKENQINLLSGHTTKIKTIEIPDDLADFEPQPIQKKLF